MRRPDPTPTRPRPRVCAVVGVLSALALGGCYDAAPVNGFVLCGGNGACPSGYHCALDRTCWIDGLDPLVDGGPPTRDAALVPTDLAVFDQSPPDRSSPPDLVAVDLTALPDLTPRGLGVACTSGATCASGNCVDGVCCDTPAATCNGCRQCNRVDSPGVCSPVAVGADPHRACAANPAACQLGACAGDGTCNAAPGALCGQASCVAGMQATFACDANAQCATRLTSCGGFACSGGACGVFCVDDTGCDAGHYCVGAQCLARAVNGLPCAAADQCQSGFCTDGVCCVVGACAQRCTSCAVGGGMGCTLVTAGSPDPRGLCKRDLAQCQSGLCTLTGDCQPVAAGSVCALWSCANATISPPRRCDGVNFGCPAALLAAPCPGRLDCRDPSSCALSCAANADCIGNSCCRGGTCFDATLATSCGPACADCTAASPGGRACVGGTSCGCVNDGDCVGAARGPRCNRAVNVCVACLSSADCSSAAPNCGGNQCAACAGNADCVNAGWGAKCAGGGNCQCGSNADCHDPTGRARRCDMASRVCVCGSAVTPCAVGKFCSDATAQAVCQ